MAQSVRQIDTSGPPNLTTPFKRRILCVSVMTNTSYMAQEGRMAMSGLQLLVQQGPRVGQSFDLNKPVITIGREAGNDIVPWKTRK